MNEFWIWFETGFTHITDLQGYDHILYVCLLALAFEPGQWKKLLVLITAFTIGHSLTLALSVTQKLHLPVSSIEFLIACSIFVTALWQGLNLLREKKIKTEAGNQAFPYLMYASALLFGLIHGLGFSFLLRSMLGAEQSITLPLFYFNLGIEAGQMLIVAIVFLLFKMIFLSFKINYRFFKASLVSLIVVIAGVMTFTRLQSF